MKYDRYTEEVAYKFERQHRIRNLKGAGILIVALILISAWKSHITKNAPQGPPPCETLEWQYNIKPGTGDCEQLKKQWESAVNFANFPG